MPLPVFPLCHLCTRVPGRGPIPFEGPIPARVLFLGECGAYHEDKLRRPFVGQTGDEFTYTYLPLSNLPRSEVYIANIVRCSRADYSNPKPKHAECCSSVFLGLLLAEVKPEIIVPMGAVACSVFGKFNLNMHHGIPRPAKYGGWEGTLFPMYHPSAGLHSTSYMIPLMQDFTELGRILLNG
jgi:uracil-DNA glycosylase